MVRLQRKYSRALHLSTPMVEGKRRCPETCLCQTPKSLQQEATWTGNKRTLWQQEAEEEHTPVKEEPLPSDRACECGWAEGCNRGDQGAPGTTLECKLIGKQWVRCATGGARLGVGGRAQGNQSMPHATGSASSRGKDDGILWCLRVRAQCSLAGRTHADWGVLSPMGQSTTALRSGSHRHSIGRRLTESNARGLFS